MPTPFLQEPEFGGPIPMPTPGDFQLDPNFAAGSPAVAVAPAPLAAAGPAAPGPSGPMEGFDFDIPTVQDPEEAFVEENGIMDFYIEGFKKGNLPEGIGSFDTAGREERTIEEDYAILKGNWDNEQRENREARRAQVLQQQADLKEWWDALSPQEQAAHKLEERQIETAQKIHEFIKEWKGHPLMEREDPIEYVGNRLPFVGAFGQFMHMKIDIEGALENIKRTGGDDHDVKTIAEFTLKQQYMAEKSWVGKSLDIMASMPGFMIEFGSTGGAFSAGKSGGMAVLKKIGIEALEKKLKNRLLKQTVGFAKNVTAALPGATLQALANPQTILRTTAQRSLDAMFESGINEDGVFHPGKVQDQSLLKHLPAGFLDGIIEMGTERTGSVVSNSRAMMGLKRAIVARWLKKGLNPKAFTNTMRKVGFDGILPEIIEERLGEVARQATGLEDHGDRTWEQFTDQLKAEAMAFAVPGAWSMRRGHKAIKTRLAEMDFAKKGRATVAELRDKVLENPDSMIEKWINDDPDRAREFAAGWANKEAMRPAEKEGRGGREPVDGPGSLFPRSRWDSLELPDLGFGQRERVELGDRIAQRMAEKMNEEVHDPAAAEQSKAVESLLPKEDLDVQEAEEGDSEVVQTGTEDSSTTDQGGIPSDVPGGSVSADTGSGVQAEAEEGESSEPDFELATQLSGAMNPSFFPTLHGTKGLPEFENEDEMVGWMNSLPAADLQKWHDALETTKNSKVLAKPDNLARWATVDSIQKEVAAELKRREGVSVAGYTKVETPETPVGPLKGVPGQLDLEGWLKNAISRAPDKATASPQAMTDFIRGFSSQADAIDKQGGVEAHVDRILGAKGRGATGKRTPVARKKLTDQEMQDIKDQQKRDAARASNEKREADDPSLFPPDARVDKPAVEDLSQGVAPEHVADMRVHRQADGRPSYFGWMPLERIKVDPARFQFKGEANERGVTQEDALEGDFDPAKAGDLLVWESRDGEVFVVNGHHRHDLATSRGTKEVKVHVVREADGFTAEDAKHMGAALNIADDKGTVEDHADFFRFSSIKQEEAEHEGLLQKAKAQIGFAVGRFATDDTYSAWKAGRISDGQARAISESAPNNEKWQNLGLQLAAKGQAAELIKHTIKALQQFPDSGKKAKQGDLFGFDDSAIQEAEAIAKAVRSIVAELKADRASIAGVAKRPEHAKRVADVDVDSQLAKERLQDLNEEIDRWERWETDKELVAAARERAGLAEPEEPEFKKKSGDLALKAGKQKKKATVLRRRGRDLPDELDLDPKATEATVRAAPIGKDPRGHIPRAMEAPEGGAKRELSPHSIIARLERDFGVKVRSGRIPIKLRGAAGFWRILEKIIRVRSELAGDLAVVSHEVAHHIDDAIQMENALHELEKEDPDLFKMIHRELARLDYNHDPVSGFRWYEGFAEYFRYRWTGGDEALGSVNAADLAPEFHKWFNGKFPTWWAKKLRDKAKTVTLDKEKQKLVAAAKKLPKFMDSIEKADKLFEEWRNEGADARVSADMRDGPTDFPPPADMTNAERMHDLVMTSSDKLYSQMVDEGHPVNKLSRLVRQLGWTGRITGGELMSAYSLSGPAHSERALENGVHSVTPGKETIFGPALYDVFKIIRPSEEEDWERYMWAKHAQEAWSKGSGGSKKKVLDPNTGEPAIDEKTGRPKKVFVVGEYHPGMDRAEANHIVSQVENDTKRAERYAEAHEIFTEYNNSLLQLMVDTGLMTAASARHMIDKWEHYIPLNRVPKDKRSQFGGEAGMLNTRSPVRGRGKGGATPIIRPMVSALKRTQQFYSAALKQAVKTQILTMVVPAFGGEAGLGHFAEVVDPKTDVTQLNVEEILTDLVDGGFVDEDMAAEFRVVHYFRTGNISTNNLIWLFKRFGVGPSTVEDWADAEEEDRREALRQLEKETEAVPDIMQVLQIYRPNYRPDASEYTETYIHNGDKIMVRWDPMIYDALDGMDRYQASGVTAFFRSVNKLKKLGAVGINTAFSLGTNLFYDWGAYQFQSKFSKGHIDSMLNPMRWIGLYGLYQIGKVADRWGIKIPGAKRAKAVIDFWEEMGGKMSTTLGGDISSIDSALDQNREYTPIERAKHGIFDIFKHPVKALLGGVAGGVIGGSLAGPGGAAAGAAIGLKGSKATNALRELVTVFEVGPRLAEFSRAMESTGYIRKWNSEENEYEIWNVDTKEFEDPDRDSLVLAINAANDVTTNFKRSGRLGKKMDAYFTFFNAAIQGQDKFFRTVRQTVDPTYRPPNGDKALIQLGRVTTWMALTFGATFAYWMARKDDDDYQNQKPWLRAGFWSFTDNQGNPFLRIPVPREYGVIKIGFEAILNAWGGKNEVKAGEVLWEWFDKQSPYGGWLSFPEIPIVKPLVENWGNWDFFRERKIVPEHLKYVDRTEQYNYHTTEMSKWIGRMFSMSPAKVDHFLESTSGGLTTQGLRTPWRGITINKDYVRDVDDFHQELNQLQKDAGTLRMRTRRELKDLGVSVKDFDKWADAVIDRRDDKAKPPKGIPASKAQDFLERERSITKLRAQIGEMDEYKDIMSALRKPIRLEKDRYKRLAYEKYIFGLARFALGRPALDRYPNPLTAKSLPQDVRDIVDEYLTKRLWTATAPSDNESRRRAQSVLDGLDIDAKKAKTLVLRRANKITGKGSQRRRAAGPEARARRIFRLRQFVD